LLARLDLLLEGPAQAQPATGAKAPKAAAAPVSRSA
jgi:hypothetical protein